MDPECIAERSVTSQPIQLRTRPELRRYTRRILADLRGLIYWKALLRSLSRHDSDRQGQSTAVRLTETLICLSAKAGAPGTGLPPKHRNRHASAQASGYRTLPGGHSTSSKEMATWRALVSLHLTRIQDPTLQYTMVWLRYCSL